MAHVAFAALFDSPRARGSQLVLRSSLGLLVAAVPAAAQTTPLVLTGDAIPGIGTVTEVRSVSVNDTGSWVAHVVTDHPNPAANEVLLEDGVVFLREGDPIAGGASTFTSLSASRFGGINAAGEVAWSQYYSSSSGELFLDGQLLLKQGDPIASPEVTAGTTFGTFEGVALNDSMQMLVVAGFDDPAISGLVDYGVLRLTLDATGAVIAQEMLFKEGDTDFGQPLYAFPLSPISRALALNASGDALYYVGGSQEGGILLNETIVAAAGTPSPIFGRNWLAFDNNVALGPGGDHAFTGRITGELSTSRLLIWNGIKVAQQGETLPAFAPHVIEHFDGAPYDDSPVKNVYVDAAGRVLWYAEWSDPDTTKDSGILRDHELILQEGVTIAAGQRIDELGGKYDYELSDSGRYLIFAARLDDGREGAFLLDLAPGILPYAGCAPNAAVLATTTPSLGLGDVLYLQMTNPQSLDVTAVAAFSTGTALDALGCGVVVPGIGELVIGTPFHYLSMFSGFLYLGVPASGGILAPDDPSLLGVEVFVQGAFLDVSVGTVEPVRLTDGLAVSIGL